MPRATPAPKKGSEDKSESALYGIPETKILRFEFDFKQTHVTVETDNPQFLKEVLATINEISGSKNLKKIIGDVEDTEETPPDRY